MSPNDQALTVSQSSGDESEMVVSRRRSLGRVSLFTIWLSAFTYVVSVPTFALGVMDFGMLSSGGIYALVLGGYGLACATALAGSAIGIVRKNPSALDWTRWSMVASVPGCLFVALAGLLLLLVGVVTSTEAVLSALTVGGMGMTMLAAAVGNLWVLIRLLRSDLDELLWYDVRSSLDVGMNLLEEEQEF